MSSPASTDKRARRRRTVVVAVLGAVTVATLLGSTTAGADSHLDSGDPRATAFPGTIGKCPAGQTTLLYVPNGNTGSNPLVQTTTTGGGTLISLSFAASLTGSQVTAYIKGGNAYNAYPIVVDGNSLPQSADQINLHAPLTKNGKIPQISHFLICQAVRPLFEVPPTLHLGYADTFHADGAAIAPVQYFPSPWKNDLGAGEHFLGCQGAQCGGPGDGKFDGGAILITNADDIPLTLLAAEVNIGPCRFNPWEQMIAQAPGGNFTANANGGRFILTQTGVLGDPMPFPCGNPIDPTGYIPQTNFDTSERPDDEDGFPVCAGPVFTPVISLTFADGTPDGITLTINDTQRILNTGGYDAAACSPRRNEATPWTPVV
jgi:hypothetical protein